MHQHPLCELILRDLRIDIGQMREEGHDPTALAAEVGAAAATGSIMGCALGTAGVAAHQVAPFHDTVTTHLCGMPELRISDLARRRFAVARRNLRA